MQDYTPRSLTKRITMRIRKPTTTSKYQPIIDLHSINWRNQALTQVCAVCSPPKRSSVLRRGVLSVIEMLQQPFFQATANSRGFIDGSIGETVTRCPLRISRHAFRAVFMRL
jgi:hypothetical protein